jgi:hypothetical protein
MVSSASLRDSAQCDALPRDAPLRNSTQRPIPSGIGTPQRLHAGAPGCRWHQRRASFRGSASHRFSTRHNATPNPRKEHR